jgi:hypothetical protein
LGSQNAQTYAPLVLSRAPVDIDCGNRTGRPNSIRMARWKLHSGAGGDTWISIGSKASEPFLAWVILTDMYQNAPGTDPDCVGHRRRCRLGRIDQGADDGSSARDPTSAASSRRGSPSLSLWG